MRINKVEYEANDCSYEVILPETVSLNVVVSNSELERNAFTSAIELALYKISEAPCAGRVKKSIVNLNCGFEYEYPLGHYNREGKLPWDHQQYLDFVGGNGDNQLDIIEFARSVSYRAEVNGYLTRLSGGAFQAIKWDSDLGLVAVGSNGKSRPVLAMSPGDLSLLRLSARCANLATKRYSCQILTQEAIRQLDPDNASRFYVEIFNLLRMDIQLIFVGSLMDMLESPLALLRDVQICDLDKKIIFPMESEE